METAPSRGEKLACYDTCGATTPPRLRSWADVYVYSLGCEAAIVFAFHKKRAAIVSPFIYKTRFKIGEGIRRIEVLGGKMMVLFYEIREEGPLNTNADVFWRKMVILPLKFGGVALRPD